MNPAFEIVPAALRSLTLAVALCVPDVAAQDRLFTHDGPAPDAGLGYAVTGLADVDGDGVGDYLVGSLGCISAEGGFARVLSGATGALIRSHVGDNPGCFGMAVADLGDLDGDGVTDYGISAVRENSQLALQGGRVYLYSGVDGSVIRIHEGDIVAGRFGISLASVGDLTGDGVNDVAIGTPWDRTFSHWRGSLDVFSGADGALVHHFDGDASEQWFGFSVAGLGDVDGDSVPDLAVGAPIQWYDPDGDEPEGFVRVVSGATALTLHEWHGSNDADHYGTSLAALPDQDGDGVAELAIGSPRHHVPDPGGPGTLEVGRVEVRSGATGSVLYETFGEELSKYGTAVRTLGDFDGDGDHDLLVGACHCQNNMPLGSGSGWFEILSGDDGARLVMQVDGKPDQSFAYSVAGVGDVTGDGVPDFVVGNTFDDALGFKTGSAFLYSGADLSLTSDRHELSAAGGGLQTFGLSAGARFAGASYLVLGTVSGTSPGIVKNGVSLPLNPDDYLELMFAFPNSAVHVGTLGVLDGAGEATASLDLPPGVLPPEAVGLVLHHAYAVFSGSTLLFGSNALPTTLLP